MIKRTLCSSFPGRLRLHLRQLIICYGAKEKPPPPPPLQLERF